MIDGGFVTLNGSLSEGVEDVCMHGEVITLSRTLRSYDNEHS
jgi:hypothetical protein